jgi:hypothetical protein
MWVSIEKMKIKHIIPKKMLIKQDFKKTSNNIWNKRNEVCLGAVD